MAMHCPRHSRELLIRLCHTDTMKRKKHCDDSQKSSQCFFCFMLILLSLGALPSTSLPSACANGQNHPLKLFLFIETGILRSKQLDRDEDKGITSGFSFPTNLHMFRWSPQHLLFSIYKPCANLLSGDWTVVAWLICTIYPSMWIRWCERRW